MKTFAFLSFLFISFYSSLSQKYDLIVAKDGSGNYNTINDAINNAPSNSPQTFSILIKAGDYYEFVTIPSDKTNIALIGEGMSVTNIIGDRCHFTGHKISTSATVDIDGNGFHARDLTIANIAGIRYGDKAEQAVALQSSSDKATFYKCSIEGFQDTIWLPSGRQFFRNCIISGTVDFICGNAAAVFQKCRIHARNRGYLVVTAQSKERPDEHTGFIFQGTNFVLDPKGDSESNVVAYLGRPWRAYSTVAIIQSKIDFVSPEGWTTMENRGLDSVTYVEYKNSGPGSSTSGRVKASGVRVLENDQQALQYTASSFLDGNSWIPQTNIPYNGGL